jgi:hypothetical protein
MAGSDIKTKRVTGTGALSVGRARIRHITVLVSSGGAGRVTITDGNGGSTLLDVDLAANSFSTIDIPDDGILATSDIFVLTATNVTAATVFWS